MTTLPPPDAPALFWIDPHNQQQGPESLTTIIERIAFNQIPPTTPVWWQGAVNWTTFNTVPEFAAALAARLDPQAGPTGTGDGSLQQGAQSGEAHAPVAQSQAGQFDTGQFDTGQFDSGQIDSGQFGTGQSATGGAEAAQPDAPRPETQPQPETTRLFDATAGTATGTATTDPTGGTQIEAPAAASSYLTDDVVDAIVVPDEAPTDAPTDAPAAAPTTPDLEPVTLEPVTLSEVDAPAAETVETATVTASAPSSAASTPAAALTPAELEETYRQLTERAQPFLAEQLRVAALNETLSTKVTAALASLGHSVTNHEESNGYHMFTVTDATGAPFSLAVSQVPYAYTVAEAIERPVALHVDRGGRASAYLYLGDYLDRGDEGDALLARHVAAVVHAASSGRR